MKFTSKTKKQLIDELEILSKRIKGLIGPEKELKESEEKFRTLLENKSHTGISQLSSLFLIQRADIVSKNSD